MASIVKSVFIISTDRRLLLGIGLLQGVPNSTVLCRLDPEAATRLMSSGHLVWGRPTLRLPVRGCHSRI
ncbi:jg14496 [Pararge aegeria aegeria]|uniref:Jg14496 protein n=1 Tax=Pararge aegeria aegeria TaxID=348720 RepID=A0A8S4RYD4_9NEOP|nr:jg14496 [Pararge aegeria aegeria]